MKIALGSDHGGFKLKNHLVEYLKQNGHDVIDYGTYSLDSCDYPDYAYPAALSVSEGRSDYAIVVCTTGIGVSIVANKVKGVRCALCTSTELAKMTRLHNNANMLALGASAVSEKLAMEIVDMFMDTEFSNEERHQRRIDKIEG